MFPRFGLGHLLTLDYSGLLPWTHLSFQEDLPSRSSYVEKNPYCHLQEANTQQRQRRQHRIRAWAWNPGDLKLSAGSAISPLSSQKLLSLSKFSPM